MRQVLDILKEHARDNSVRFVFPSEVAARFWRRGILDAAGISAVRSDRIVSWDTFKETAFPGRENRRPVNAALRVFFVRDLLRKNREAPFLRWFVRPGFAETASVFARSLRSVLPRLETVLAAVGRTGVVPDEDLVADLRLLRGLYGDFLRAGGLYEPAFEEKGKPRLDGTAYLFFPDVIADYEDFRPALEASGRVLAAGIPEADVPFLDEYGNTFQEIRGLMTRIAALLDSGTPAGDIMVSFPGVEDCIDLLEEQAKLQGVPIRIRQGRSLSSCPGGNFFAAAAGAVSGGFRVDDLKGFLLDGAFPWKNPELARDAVLLGTAKSCLGAHAAAGVPEDPWRDALRTADAELREFMDDLLKALRRLTGASSFAEIRMRVQAFAARFFDAGAWKREPRGAFQLALAALAELAAAEKAAGAAVAEPFPALAEILEETIYVPRLEEEGIDVYPYRVGAGVYPAHHFIVNASHESTEAADASLAFLREDHREALGFAGEDTGPRFLALYAASGRKVSFSFAGETRRNTVLPPGFFVARDRVRPAPRVGEERRADAALRETDFWAGAAAAPFSRGPLPHQREGYKKFDEAASAPKGTDAAREALPPGPAAEKLREKVSRDGVVGLSPTGLETFAACPFRFLLEKLLGIGELPLETGYDNPRVEGILYHEAFRDLMREIARRDGPFRARNLPAYRDLVPPLVGDLIAGLLRKDEYPPSPVRAAWAEKMAEDLGEFLRREAEVFDGLETRGTELSLSVPVDEARAVLAGRLDRVAGLPGDPACVVVDYKTGKLPARKSLRGEEGGAASVQMPAYVFLLEKSGSPVRSALYYAVRDGGYAAVFARDEDAWLDADAMAEAENRLVRLLAAAAERIRAGDYRVLPGDCEPCAFRGVCRMKYPSEREGRT